MKEKESKNLEKIIKTILYIVLLIIGGYMLATSKITGLTIQSSTAVVAGSFLGVIFLFFIIVLILIKLKAKSYKSNQ